MHRPAIQNLLPLRSDSPRPLRRLISLSAGLALCGILVGCASVPDFETWDRAERARAETDARGVVHGAPGWDGRPVSWSKLLEIEDWLNEPPHRRDEAFVAEAEIQLAEGRLVLTRREMDRLNARLMTLRLDAAEAGFQRALHRGDLRGEQRRRAEGGLTELASLRGGTPGLASGAPNILTRERWGAKTPVRARLTASARPYERITVHHSAEPTSDLGQQTTAEVADRLRRIQRFQMREWGFGDVGYHFLIDPQGRVWQGRPMEWQGAHSDGDNNIANIGICLLGNFDAERPTAKALRSLEQLIAALGQRHGIPRSRVFGHDHWKATECPGTYLNRWLAGYTKNAALASSTQ